MSPLRITLTRSTIGHPENQKETARTLGLTRINRTVVRPDSPVIRGMIETIRHLVSVEETDQEDKAHRGP
jgi:large subunit ribosomal protein L30